jgi:ABC-type transport system involved in cytochrome c biogenesis permease subunit
MPGQFKMKNIHCLILGATLIFSGMLIGGNAGAQDSPVREISLSLLKRMPVLDQGRIKPVDTYAGSVLLQLSGRRSFEKQSAVQWLARLLFAPEATKHDKVFLINSPEIPMAMGVEPDKKRRYSFAQLENGYHKLFSLAQASAAIEEKERSAVEQEVLRVYTNMNLYVDLSRVFAFGRPHPDFTVTQPEIKKQLNLSEEQIHFSFLDIALRANEIEKITRQLEAKNKAEWTDPEKEVLGLLSTLYQWSLQYRNLPFAIVPFYERHDERWLSPWDAVAAGFQAQAGREELAWLQGLSRVYLDGQSIEFNLILRRFNDSVQKRIVEKQKAALKVIPLEIVYNKANFFPWAKLFYLLSFFMFLFSLISARGIWYRLGWGLVILGFIPHAAGLIFRIAILARPPVSNLYETFVFVGFVSVVVGLIVERINRQWLGLIVAGICGFVFLSIAGKYAAEGDTMQMLIAVLNSNFWLSTHVTSITIGYAGCCVAGVVGHVYIIQAITRPQDKKLLSTTYKNLMGILGFGLIMTFLGTALGGIWADQSWGRFWGWDPKENGALLIVLWTAILFHARIAKMTGPLGIAVGSCLGIIVVMWAWFGVNLLSVGLHSYGFTSGVAAALLIYVLVQVLFLGISAPIAEKKLKHTPAP